MSPDQMPSETELADAIERLEGVLDIPPSMWAEIHVSNTKAAIRAVLPILRARYDRAMDRVPENGQGEDDADLSDVHEQLHRLAEMVTETRQDLGQLQDTVEVNERDVTDLVERVGELEGAA